MTFFGSDMLGAVYRFRFVWASGSCALVAFGMPGAFTTSKRLYNTARWLELLKSGQSIFILIRADSVSCFYVHLKRALD